MDSHNVILTADRDGAVVEFTEGPDALLERLPAGLNTQDIWKEPAAAVVARGIKRALRGRSAHSAVSETAQGKVEFVFVPQGRDRVLVVARDDGKVPDQGMHHGRPELMDPGTGLPNRAFLTDELEQIVVTQRLKEGRVAVLCLYIELQEPSVGALGAGKEDELLTKLAARLAGQLRGMNDEDPVDYERYSVLARTDYRQFVVVLPEIDTGEDAEAVLCRLIESLQETVTVGTRQTSACVSGGLALFPQDGTDAETLLANAAAAMIDARDSASTSYRFHSGTVRLRSLQRQDVAADLRSALARDAFEIRFLPVVAASSGQPRSAEALLRWPETVFGAVSTQKIVTTAEHTGVIVEIGDWVTRTALETLQGWRQSGHDGMRVSINLSGQEFASPDLANRVALALAETGADPASVEFEIKEHMVARDAARDFATIQSLKALGVGLLLDDYGTGACTLADLSRCPLDAIKIDLSLVASLETNARDRAACAAAVGMAHGLGMRVVAEGVETESQAAFLREAGCEELQGFLYSMPLSGEELLNFLDGNGDERTRIA
jgi:EAL domain-containing protein (putative c-di-GMP-specific phosphodiesterase class I)/GGDEF domain-containing protein